MSVLVPTCSFYQIVSQLFYHGQASYAYCIIFSPVAESNALVVCLFDLILKSKSIIFQLLRDGSSWVEPVLSRVKCVLLKDTTQ